MTIKRNKEVTMLDRAEEIQKRYNLAELPDELVEVDPADLPVERDWGGLGERSGRAAYMARRPWLKPAKKEIMKDESPLISPGMTSLRYINEKILPQINWLKKSVEDTDVKIGDLLLRANTCANQACRLFGKLHVHMEG